MVLRETLAGPADLFALHRRWPADYPFLLQSVAGHPVSGRYDILFAFPNGHLSLSKSKLIHSGFQLDTDNFFSALSTWFQAEKTEEIPGELPFAGGWFLLVGYEAVRQIEPRLKLPASPHTLPDALAVRCPAAVIYDRQTQELTLLAEEDRAQLERLKRDVACCAGELAKPSMAPLVGAVEEDPPERFLSGVETILEYLHAGDVFQVNLSRAWRAGLVGGVDYADLYTRLRISNPAPFAGVAYWQGSAVLSSSPERLVQIDGSQVQTRPIAGTRPRGANAIEDQRLREQLIANVKERAEHIMLIDLERNDLGRVCEPGSVSVSELMTVESYAHVHHIVSNVRGRLRADVGPGDVLKAIFPGGTITGCPKVRAMEIIAELEQVGRGPYTGAMGYLSRDGRMDTNILIRSLVCENGKVSLRAGAGIVADSNPQSELAETSAKAKGLLAALGARA